MKFKTILLMILFSSVFACADNSKDIEKCALINNSIERLKCYDGLTKRADMPASIEEQQVNACTDDVKLGLNDPDSFKLFSTRGIEVKNGWFRIELKYSAKNAFGGRVKGDSVCGFLTKDSTTLNQEDFMNQERKLARDLKSLGM